LLQRVGRGVYATTSSAGDHLSLRAAWLALDPADTAELRLVNPIAAGVISHASAASLHQLGDLLDDQHEFTLAQRKQTAPTCQPTSTRSPAATINQTEAHWSSTCWTWSA